jgi:hypothetical protein
LVKVYNFKCRVCKAYGIKPDAADMKLGNGIAFERVNIFCYLRDMLKLG